MRCLSLLVLVLWSALAASPANAQADDAKKCRLIKSGAEAVAACSRLIESGKFKGVNLYLHYNDRGGAHQSGGTDANHHKAIEDFGKAIAIDRKLPYAYINRGVSWAALGAHDSAIEDFTQAIKVDPKNAAAHNNRGGAYRDKGEFERAMVDFNKAIALDSKNSDALFNRATVYMQKDDFNRAIADYSSVIKQNPKDIIALAARGRGWSGKDDFKRAQADFEAALAAPAEDKQSRDVKDAVRELLRALLERKASLEMDALQRKAALEKAAAEKQAALENATREKRAAEERQAALERQAAQEKRAAQEKQAALERQAAREKKEAEERQAALEKQAAQEKRAAQERQAALERQAAREKRAAEEQQAALEKQAAQEKIAAKEKRDALEKQAAREKRAAEERQAALERQAAQEKRAAQEKQAALEKQAAREKKQAEERQAALEMQAARDKKAAEEKQAALEQQAAREKAAREKQAALQKPPPPVAPPLAVDPPRRIDRIALVIGNAAYHPTLGKLDNPANDARDVAKTLEDLGFTVWLGIDLGHVEMKAMLARFARAAADVETAVVFFAGHGFQYGNANYLAPIDAPLTDDNSIARHVNLETMLGDLRSERGFRIVIIDACRNNLAVQAAAVRQVPATRSVVAKRGLRPVIVSSTKSGGSMLVAFATLPGEVASDGAGRNSPFTQALVKHLPTPKLELRHLFVRVRAEVLAATGGRQNPQVSDALNGEYVFKAAQ